MKIGWVSGDDIYASLEEFTKIGLQHLDEADPEVILADETEIFLTETKTFSIASAHAYVGARGIKRGLDLGCDIIICKPSSFGFYSAPFMKANFAERK